MLQFLMLERCISLERKKKLAACVFIERIASNMDQYKSTDYYTHR